jgi:arylsulfatase
VEDFSQANDLAAANPEKLRQLQDLWWVEASRYNVLPLDWRATERFDSELMGRPSLIAGRKMLTYYPGVVGLPLSSSPPLLNKSWTITADVELPEGGGEGMIVTEGGLEGGIGLSLRDGRPIFVYNFLSLERPTFAGKDPLPKGKSQITVKFDTMAAGPGRAQRSRCWSTAPRSPTVGWKGPSLPVLTRRGLRRRHGSWLAVDSRTSSFSSPAR